MTASSIDTYFVRKRSRWIHYENKMKFWSCIRVRMNTAMYMWVESLHGCLPLHIVPFFCNPSFFTFDKTLKMRAHKNRSLNKKARITTYLLLLECVSASMCLVLVASARWKHRLRTGMLPPCGNYENSWMFPRRSATTCPSLSAF